MRFERLRRALEQQLPVHDTDFDSVYPLQYRQVSAQYWTPVGTARRATELLVREGARRVLDVGAGVGKFCLVGAASTDQASFVGIEHRARLVQAARDAKERLGFERVEILHGRLDEIDAAAFDAFYLFNPFGENLLRCAPRLGDDVPLSRERYEADVGQVTSMLAAAPPGTRVVIFNGYGGTMPPRYDLVHAERQHRALLQLWVQRG